MRTVSTGVGLCVLGVCVLGAAALSSPRLGNTASAAGGTGQRAKNVPGTTAPQISNRTQSPEGTRSSFLGHDLLAQRVPATERLSTPCDSVQSWFSGDPKPISTPCGQYKFSYGSYGKGEFDVNEDGVLEYLLSGPGRYFTFLEGGVAQQGCLVETDVLSTNTEGEVSASQVCVYDTSELVSWGQRLGLTNGGGAIYGLRDMDRDGDLDLILSIAGDGAYVPSEFCWIENTGFQKAPPPNPYDHDGDGHVNTSDLSLMLMEFTD